jgi:2-(1,2-epoxy-1,2-dihydrophenyl)acetyl-CoA isomerase
VSANSTGIAPASAVPSDVVLYEVVGRVAEVTLNRPEVSNAVDLDVARHLRRAVDQAVSDSAVDVLLLRGAGRLFCGGGDLAAMRAAPDRPAFLASLANAAHEAVRAIHALEKPVVAAVQGAAAGIGFSLVVAADLVVAGESARFVTAYTSLGLTPDGGLSWLLPRAIGERRAVELLLTSDPLDAARAQAFGIVSEICCDDDVLPRSRATAARLAARPTHALGAARRLVRTSWGHTLEEHLDTEAQAIARASATDEAAALIAGFLDRG